MRTIGTRCLVLLYPIHLWCGADPRSRPWVHVRRKDFFTGPVWQGIFRYLFPIWNCGNVALALHKWTSLLKNTKEKLSLMHIQQAVYCLEIVANMLRVIFLAGDGPGSVNPPFITCGVFMPMQVRLSPALLLLIVLLLLLPLLLYICS